MRRPLLLGHRGARRGAPENTFAAFDLALAQGCNGFEFDVRRTADGRGFVCHDPIFERLKIATATFAQLSARRRHTVQILPCIDDVLERYAAAAFLDIELKEPGLEDVVCTALREHMPQRGYVVSSFLPEVITALHSRDARLPLGLICDTRRQLERWSELAAGFVMPHRSLVSEGLVETLHEAGKQVFVWTVNDWRTMLRLADSGVDAIISDDPALLSRTLTGR